MRRLRSSGWHEGRKRGEEPARDDPGEAMKMTEARPARQCSPIPKQLLTGMASAVPPAIGRRGKVSRLRREALSPAACAARSSRLGGDPSPNFGGGVARMDYRG